MSGKDSNIFPYDTCPAISQIHNALKGGAGWDQIADVGKEFTSGSHQVVQDWDCHEYDHYHFDVNDAYHQPVRNPANKQTNQG